MLPSLHLLPLLGLLTCGCAGFVGAAEQASRADMVRKLGDDAFGVREMATRQLGNLGLDAKAELLAGIRGDDPEIRWRCELLWSQVRDADFQQRAEAFLGDAEGLADYEFPGWPAYRGTHSTVRTMQHRLYDCFWQMRLPDLGYASDVSVALTTYLYRSANGGVINLGHQSFVGDEGPLWGAFLYGSKWPIVLIGHSVR